MTKGSDMTKPKAKRRHTLEVQIERIDNQMARLKTFEEWEAGASEGIRRLASEKHGSMRAFYDAFVGSYAEIRAEFVAKLKSIKGNQNGTKRR